MNTREKLVSLLASGLVGPKTIFNRALNHGKDTASFHLEKLVEEGHVIKYEVPARGKASFHYAADDSLYSLPGGDARPESPQTVAIVDSALASRIPLERAWIRA